MLTFDKIIDICREDGEQFPDYYQALFRSALIFIDQGRGEEAINFLGKMEVPEKDTRYGARDLEIASAYIDQKEYDKAIIEKLHGYKDEEKWGSTFTFRKASLYRIKCLLEWRKNKPTEFKINEKREWKEEYKNIPKEIKGDNANEIKGIIEECINRKDEVNFKKACRYFSEFFKLKKEFFKEKQSKENNEKAGKSEEVELYGYFLYLFHEKMHDAKKDLKVILDKGWKDVKKELYEDENYVDRVLDKIEDTEYMQDFFDSYIDYLKGNKKDDQYGAVIEKLYNRLKDLYQEKDNLSKLGEVEEKFRLSQEESGKSDTEEKEKKKTRIRIKMML
ncbi:hypothetical protein ES705_44393 [subsurface metagenome]